MMTLELTAIDGTTANITISDDKGRTCEAVVYGDGSRRATAGAAWLLDKAYKAAGRRDGWADAMRQVRNDGRAVIA